jgi:hypothetical protein
MEKSFIRDCKENSDAFHFTYIFSENRDVDELITKKGWGAAEPGRS